MHSTNMSNFALIYDTVFRKIAVWRIPLKFNVKNERHGAAHVNDAPALHLAVIGNH